MSGLTGRVIIVGVGGVGTHLAGPLCRYLANSAPEGSTVSFVDGDVFEPKNLDRQEFRSWGNKAEVRAGELRADFPALRIEHVPEFVTQHNIGEVVPDGSIVFCCVDNHASRKLLSEHVSGLETAVLISGGNDYHDGNVQVYVRSKGADVSPPLTAYHDEIMHPTDKNPAEMSCEEKAAAGSPQLIFANLKVATEMLCAMWAAAEAAKEGRGVPYTEAYFDIKQGAQRPIKRKVTEHGTEASSGPGVDPDGHGTARAAGSR